MLSLSRSLALQHATTTTPLPSSSLTRPPAPPTPGAFPPADRDRILDLIFSTKPGCLGLEVARYNIGGSGWDSPDAPNLRAGANVAAYAGPGGMYDWSQDAAQRACLLGARDRGAHTFEAFANSPPYWMTASGRASGAAWGWATNLPKTAVGAFADYLVAVVAHFREVHGLHFSTIAPFNEPCEISWWAGTNQEGCRFTPRQQRRVVAALAARLRAAGMLAPVPAPAPEGGGAWGGGGLVAPTVAAPPATPPPVKDEVKLAVSDENAVDRATSSLEAALARSVRRRSKLPQTRPIDGRPPTAQAGGVVATLAGLAPPDLAAIGRVNTHGYSGAAARPALAAVAALAGLPVWMSEVGYGHAPPAHPASASTLAAHVAADINTMGVEGWVYWQAVEDADGGSWRGLLARARPLTSLPFRFGFTCANWWWATKQAARGAVAALAARRRAVLGEYLAPWWGLVLVSFSGRGGRPGCGPADLTVSKQFHGLAHYSRAMRAGWRVVEVPPERAADTVVALAPGGAGIAIIATNDTDRPRPVAFDLAHFLATAGAGGGKKGKAAKGGASPAPSAWVAATRTDAAGDGAPLPLVCLGGGCPGESTILEDALPPRSVTTYLVTAGGKQGTS